jgi:hypothetical protein
MGNFQKYSSQNVGQDFIVPDFFIGGRSCGRKTCVREINISHAGDPVHAGDKALTQETPTQRGRVNRYGFTTHSCTSCTLSPLFHISLHITVLHIHCNLFFYVSLHTAAYLLTSGNC